MDLHTVFLAVFIITILFAAALLMWTIYEFIVLDKHIFRFNILGIIFFEIAILFILFRFIVFPPLSDFENIIFGFPVAISGVLAMLSFIKASEITAQKFGTGFVRDEKFRKIVFGLMIGVITLDSMVFMIWPFVSENVLERAEMVSGMVWISMFLSVLFLLIKYQKSFGGMFSNIMLIYVITVALLGVAAIIINQALLTIQFENITFTDLSYVRNITAILGASVAFILGFVCFRSIHLFRKLL